MRVRNLSMTHLNLNTLSKDNDISGTTPLSGLLHPITISEVKDIFMSSRSREDRLRVLKTLRSELFTYDLADVEEGYSSLIAEIDRVICLLELSPIGTADPEVLQRVDGIKSNT